EKFFWQFCDDYLELVKERAYGADGQAGSDSARAALRLALDVQLRLFAPFLPFVTEEVWSWWRTGSVHTSRWPVAAELPTGGAVALIEDVAAALIGIRGAKSNAKASMKAEVARAEFSGPSEVLDRLRLSESDLRAVGRITGSLEFRPSEGALQVSVDLL
ncbi:MAG: valine--tRNA ligase, partial [Propionibacteriales bacterium]|nr:valine--tRNA ligase [Propionibacteriales bacterium]